MRRLARQAALAEELDVCSGGQAEVGDEPMNFWQTIFIIRLALSRSEFCQRDTVNEALANGLSGNYTICLLVPRCNLANLI